MKKMCVCVREKGKKGCMACVIEKREGKKESIKEGGRKKGV
jgi:hypothetical protein